MPFDKIKLLTKSSDGHDVILAETLTYTAQDGRVFVVPIGSESDGASVPRILWRLFPPFGAYWRAALLHDHLYRNSNFTKSTCDKLLHEAMLACDVPRAKAWTIYTGVKLFGRMAFNNCRKKLKETKKMKQVKLLILATFFALGFASSRASEIKFQLTEETTFLLPFQIVNASMLYSFEEGRGYPAAETPLLTRASLQVVLGAAPAFGTSSNMPFVAIQTRLTEKFFDISNNDFYFGVYAGHRDGQDVHNPGRAFNVFGIKASTALW